VPAQHAAGRFLREGEGAGASGSAVAVVLGGGGSFHWEKICLRRSGEVSGCGLGRAVVAMERFVGGGRGARRFLAGTMRARWRVSLEQDTVSGWV
jgi:hypothetical protein